MKRGGRFEPRNHDAVRTLGHSEALAATNLVFAPMSTATRSLAPRDDTSVRAALSRALFQIRRPQLAHSRSGFDEAKLSYGATPGLSLTPYLVLPPC
jgi:hypothetical protein